MSDLEELTGVAFWTLFLAFLVFSVVLSVVLTWPVCALVLAVYRRSVRAGMRTAAGRGSRAAPASRGSSAPLRSPAPAPRIAVTEIPERPTARPRRPGPPPGTAGTGRVRGRRAGVRGGRPPSSSTGCPATAGRRGPFLVQALLLSWLAVPTVIALGVPRPAGAR